jgi:hypothetical protein
MKTYAVTHVERMTPGGKPLETHYVSGEHEGEALGDYLAEHEETLDLMELPVSGLRFTELVPTGRVFEVKSEPGPSEGTGRSFLVQI